MNTKKMSKPVAFLFAVAATVFAQSQAGLPGFPPTVADGSRPTVIYEENAFFEGPAWDPATGKLYFTAFKKDNQQILRLDVTGKASIWMDKTQGVNGMRVSRNGRLLGAQAYGHNVLSMKIGADGPQDVKSLTANFEGQTYNQPNDLAEAPNGGIYYTDPDFKGKTRSAVFYLSPEGNVRRIITHLKIPNGILVSNDGKTLYVADSFEKRIYSYSILPDGSVDQGAVKVFFDPATDNRNDPDGMCADAEGNLYFAMRGGVWVASPQGKTLGFIPIPEFTSNVGFGGKDGKMLFMTCDKKVYALEMKVRGSQFK
jgi:gluconolactonase